ncbi:carbohydrate ABC transporter permease [Paenibacillus sp. FSL H8-0034]|uniref:carbohydrate ABC transporter permease n=1 Tax=Paenibacillus sp. FSL H8-0034 TaxID=2954671 RepID=UPI0030F56556
METAKIPQLSQVKGKATRKRQHKIQLYWIYLFLLPQTVMYLVFTLWPIIASYYFSFFKWDGIGWPTQFIGLSNYIEVAQDSYFWNAFKNSFVYTFFLVLIVVPCSLVLALVLNSKSLKFKVFFRTMFFVPVVLTMSIIGVIMNVIFSTDGFANKVLLSFGIIDTAIPWLTSPTLAMICLIIVGVWKGFGIKVIYWLAGLQTLPLDVYEAARIDGANRLQEFRYITVPLLIPFLVIITFFQTVWSLNVFDLVRTFTNGGPMFTTDVVPLYIYRYAFEGGSLPRMGFASAAGILYGFATMIISILLGLLVKKFSGRRAGH